MTAISTVPTLDVVPAARTPRASRPSLTNLADLSGEVLASHATLAKAKGVRLRLLAGPDEAVMTISCDRDGVRQVVTHLVSHALAHTPSGGSVEVSVNYHSGPFGERRAMVSVADRSTVDLAMCEHTALDMGGTIVMDSDVGTGSVLTLVLPASLG